MGCDGGTIPRRDELVKVKKKPEQKDKLSELSFKWRCCDITQETLVAPIVACGLGNLYNKSAVIEGLLNRTLLPVSAKHIRGLKDIKDLNLTPNPEYDSNAEKTEGMIDTRSAPYICPVTGIEMSGKFRFIFIWSCGCVMSERAIKEINTTVCHKCQQPFDPTDVVVLNGNDEDLVQMRRQMDERKAKRKTKRNVVIAESQEKDVMNTPSTSSTLVPSTAPSTTLNITTSIKRTNDATVVDNTLEDPEIKKMKIDYSVAKDPKVTDVYKSLFTSHQSEKDQTRAHWVTYNPFYN